MDLYVLGFMFDSDGKYVALIRKNRPDWQAGRLNGIGGHIEDGELEHEAMRREFLEETGIDHENWIPFAHLYKVSKWVVYVFVAFTDNVVNVRTMTDEEVVLCQVNDETCDAGVDNLAWLLRMARDPRIRTKNSIRIEYLFHEGD